MPQTYEIFAGSWGTWADPGDNPIPATGPDAALELVESRSTPKRVTIQVYRPTGRPQ
jgi:hypothetical protein